MARINATPKNTIIATTDPTMIRKADVVTIAVPTPVTRSKDPDISYVVSAAETIGHNLKNGAIIVLESTVYPGLTEEVMVPVLERASGMKCGKDFFVGYSPERINPGDPDHTLDKITKIVSGMDEGTTKRLSEIYSLVTNVYIAPDIRTAEAAKVIENIQEISISHWRMSFQSYSGRWVWTRRRCSRPLAPSGTSIDTGPGLSEAIAYLLMHTTSSIRPRSLVITPGDPRWSGHK